MGYSDSILPEFDDETAGTRKVLEWIPDDKLDWQPHPKSAHDRLERESPSRSPRMGRHVDPGEFARHQPARRPALPRTPKLTTSREILDLLDKNVAAARANFEAVTDGQIMHPWSLLNAGQPIFTMPKAGVMRSFVLNHIIHHRDSL